MFLNGRKADIHAEGYGWYPYGTLSNFYLLDQLLKGDHREIGRLIADDPIVDIGAADGDTAFFMEWLGFRAHAVDYPPTNFNGCQGIRALRDALKSKVELHERDLDHAFTLPAETYGLAFFLGILYHLKNPFQALESLAHVARHAFISTRVARFNVAATRLGRDTDSNPNRVDLSGIPVAYLVDELECNEDPTNFWMFSESGLRRVLKRTGWDILDFQTFGNRTDSDPATANGDERAFCLVRSKRFNWPP